MTNTILGNLIDFLFERRIKIIPIFFNQIIFFSVIIKSIDKRKRFLNKLQLL